jgi:hypothetical protein
MRRIFIRILELSDCAEATLDDLLAREIKRIPEAVADMRP